MGDLKSYVQDWLEGGGYDLGYCIETLPEMRDMDWIISSNVDARLYFEEPEYRVYKREFINLTGGK